MGEARRAAATPAPCLIAQRDGLCRPVDELTRLAPEPARQPGERRPVGPVPTKAEDRPPAHLGGQPGVVPRDPPLLGEVCKTDAAGSLAPPRDVEGKVRR